MRKSPLPLIFFICGIIAGGIGWALNSLPLLFAGYAGLILAVAFIVGSKIGKRRK